MSANTRLTYPAFSFTDYIDITAVGRLSEQVRKLVHSLIAVVADLVSLAKHLDGMGSAGHGPAAHTAGKGLGASGKSKYH